MHNDRLTVDKKGVKGRFIMADKDYASLHFEEEFAEYEKTDNKKQKELQKHREKEQKQNA